MMKNIIRLIVLFITINPLVALSETIISDRFCADPSIHKYNGRFYLYATNDQDNSGKYWDSTDWRLFSSDNLKVWKDEGSFLSASIFKWAKAGVKAWAPGGYSRNGKYYFYAPVGGNQIGVAISDSPEGPFIDARSNALVDNSRDKNAGDEPIDPAIFVDNKGQAYMYFGTRVPKVVKLNKDMVSLESEIFDVEIIGFPKSDIKKSYGEAPFLHQHKGLYYFSFSTGWPGQIVYAIGHNPMGPFTYQGVIIDYLKISTNHQAIINDGDNSYLFYHDNIKHGGGDFKRSIIQTPLKYKNDGSIEKIKVSGG
ncbi:MAG: family 43 glycosylhydrolase [Colwellia sp.]